MIEQLLTHEKKFLREFGKYAHENSDLKIISIKKQSIVFEIFQFKFHFSPLQDKWFLSAIQERNGRRYIIMTVYIRSFKDILDLFRYLRESYIYVQ